MSLALARMRPARLVQRPGADGVTMLSLFAVLLTCSPSVYVVGPLGAAGTPAQVLAMTMTLWWAGHKLARPYTPSRQRRPVRTAMMLFICSVLISYVVGNLRPIAGTEASAADRGLLAATAWLGIVLIAGDHIPARYRLDVLLRRLVLAGSAVAALGLVQFETGLTLTNYLKLPGLRMNSDLVTVGGRNGFLRVASTALSPIEFGVAMMMLLPIALHYAMSDRESGRVRRWLPVLLLAATISISISRSTLLCAIVGVGLMLPVMSRGARVMTGLGSLALFGATFVLVPGMLGTLAGLFTGIGDDSSAASRTGSYALAGEFISRSPFFGRGLATFLPEYRILDNQYLGTTIELGFIGLVALLGLFLTGLVTAWAVRRRTEDQATRQLAQALLASLAAGAVSFAFFDAFSFPMVAGLTFLVLGAISCLDMVTPRPAPETPPMTGSDAFGTPPSGQPLLSGRELSRR